MRGLRIDQWARIGAAVLGILLAGFLVLSLVIGGQVRRAVAQAQGSYPGSPLAALSGQAASPEAALVDRNRAIWALGQLGSSDVLPVLQSLSGAGDCDHERRLCQRELDKAIAACSGSFNPAALVWRHGALAMDRISQGANP